MSVKVSYIEDEPKIFRKQEPGAILIIGKILLIFILVYNSINTIENTFKAYNMVTSENGPSTCGNSKKPAPQTLSIARFQVRGASAYRMFIRT